MRRTVIAEPPTKSVAVDMAGSAARVGLANTAALAVSANRAVRAVSANLVVPAVSANLVVPAESESLAALAASVSPVDQGVAVDQVPCRRVGRAAAAVPIVSAVVNLQWAAAAARSAAAAETTLAPVAAGAAIAWAAVVLVAAEAVVAAAVEAVAVAAVAVAAADAGDEQLSNGINTYEIEIKRYELVKNFFTCLWNRHVSCGGVFITGCVGNKKGSDGTRAIQPKAIQHPERS